MELIERVECIESIVNDIDLDNPINWKTKSDLETHIEELKTQLNNLLKPDVSGRSEQSSIICNCGNKLTEKEVFHNHCLNCCSEIIED